MRSRRDSPFYKPERVGTDQAEYSEFEEEIKPPVQKRLIQITITILVVIAAVSVIVAKVMSDQRQEATKTADKAVAAQSTAQAQVAALAAQVDSMTATLQAPGRPVFTVPGVISGTQSRRQFGREGAAQTRSRQLAYVALTSLADDPERGILIALEANQAAHTPEAEDALRRALQASHVRYLMKVPDGNIQTAEFSPNGALIATTDSSGVARVWSSSDGREELQLHTAGKMLSAQFSPDGRFILTLSTNQTAALWDASTGSTVTVYSGSGVDFTTAQFSSYANRIATGSADGGVNIWYTNGVSNALVLSSTLGSIRRVEWSSDDRLILATSDQGLALWDTQSAKQLYTITNGPEDTTIHDARFTPDGKQLVMTDISGGGIRILDAYTARIVRTIDGDMTGTIQLSPDGSQLLTGGGLYNLQTGQAIAHLPNEPSFAAQYSPNGRYLVTHSDPYTLTVWNVQTGPSMPSEVATMVGGDAAMVRFSPFNQLLVSVGREGTARVWSVVPDANLPADYQELLALARTRVTRQLSCHERLMYLNDSTTCESGGD